MCTQIKVTVDYYITSTIVTAVTTVFQFYDLNHFFSGRDSPLQSIDLLGIVYIGISSLTKIGGIGNLLGIPVVYFS